MEAINRTARTEKKIGMEKDGRRKATQKDRKQEALWKRVVENEKSSGL